MDRLLEFVINHWELVSLFVVLLVAILVMERQRGGRSLSPQQLVLRLNRDDVAVLDVREKKDMSDGRISGSVHIPYTALKSRLDELQKYREKGIVVVDKMGQHSGAAVKILKAAGFEQVERMSGGINEWQTAGLPLKRK